MQGCWHEGRLVKLLTFGLPGRKFDQSFFREVQSVVQHMHNCGCETQTATTGTRLPLVASQYSKVLVLLCYCFTSTVNIYRHVGTAS